jgi:hypothetical protein
VRKVGAVQVFAIGASSTVHDREVKVKLRGCRTQQVKHANRLIKKLYFLQIVT